MRELKHSYPSVEKDGGASYGGNQTWSHRGVIREWGCGVIAAADLLLYLHWYREGCQTVVFDKIPKSAPIPLAAYERLLRELGKRYFPVIPHFGMNGLGMAAGLNCYFRKHRLPLRARWAVWSKDIWTRMEAMLSDDLPVILAIGQNVPFFWMKHKLRLYMKNAQGRYQSACTVRAHYVTVTGMDQRWLHVSSWGREYFINREEYERYVKKYSSYFVSNILDIRTKSERFE